MKNLALNRNLITRSKLEFEPNVIVFDSVYLKINKRRQN